MVSFDPMLRTLIHNPRRRGLVGALIGAAGPYALWASGNGLLLGGHPVLIAVVAGFSGFFALLGYGICHGAFAMKAGSLDDDLGRTHRDMFARDQRDFIAQEGLYAQMRDQWDPNYMRDKY